MPCDSIRSTDIDLGKSDGGLIHAALKEMGLNPQAYTKGGIIYFNGGEFDTRDNVLTLRGSNVQERTRELKQAYSGEVVKSQAKRFGWALKQSNENKYEYTVTKRSI